MVVSTQMSGPDIRTRAETSAQIRKSAENTALAFPALLIAAEKIADTVIHGVHGRRRAGPGEDFWQYRPYSAGDAAHRIDWRRSAKRNRLFIRENEWAATNTLWTWAAPTTGMAFKSHLSQTTKYERAATLALALSILSIKAGERIAGLDAPFNAGHTRATLNQLSDWYQTSQNRQHINDLPTGQTLPRFSSVVLFSDFLSPIDEIKHSLHTLASAGTKGHLVQIFDPIEETFPFSGRVEFADTSSVAKIMTGKAQTLKSAYIEKLTKHRAQVRDLATSLGWTFTLHHSDQPASVALLKLHHLISGQLPPTTSAGK